MARRVLLLTLASSTALAGYWIRLRSPLPEWIRDPSGGAFYVVFWMLACGFIWPFAPPRRVAILALAGTCTIELLQLWHPAWLELLRRTLPGRLVLGTTFQWSDFPPYIVGALLGWAVLLWIRR